MSSNKKQILKLVEKNFMFKCRSFFCNLIRKMSILRFKIWLLTTKYKYIRQINKYQNISFLNVLQNLYPTVKGKMFTQFKIMTLDYFVPIFLIRSSSCIPIDYYSVLRCTGNAQKNKTRIHMYNILISSWYTINNKLCAYNKTKYYRRSVAVCVFRCNVFRRL